MFPEKTIAANRTKYRQHLFFFIKNGGFDFIYENRLENAGEAYSETISQAPTASVGIRLLGALDICIGFVVRGQRKFADKFRNVSGFRGAERSFREGRERAGAFHFFDFLRNVAVVDPGVAGAACRVEGRRKAVEFKRAQTEQSFCAELPRLFAAEIIGDDGNCHKKFYDVELGNPSRRVF